jgi:hypothetical protein
MNLSEIPTDEMVEDYYASLMDMRTFERLGFPPEHEHIAKNRMIMDVIHSELERRGKLDRISDGK